MFNKIRKSLLVLKCFILIKKSMSNDIAIMLTELDLCLFLLLHKIHNKNILVPHPLIFLPNK